LHYQNSDVHTCIGGTSLVYRSNFSQMPFPVPSITHVRDWARLEPRVTEEKYSLLNKQSK